MKLSHIPSALILSEYKSFIVKPLSPISASENGQDAKVDHYRVIVPPIDGEITLTNGCD